MNRWRLLAQWLKLEAEAVYKIALLSLIILLAFALGYIGASQNQPAAIIIERQAVTGD